MTSWLFETFPGLKEYGNLPAIFYKNTSMSYLSVSREIESLARELKKRGVSYGMRISLLGESNLPTLIAILALLQIGASVCVLSTRLPKETVIQRALEAKSTFFLDAINTILTPIGVTKEKNQYILLFTSGSSGKAKLACLTINHFLASALSSISLLGLVEPNKYYFLSVPLFHVSGLSILFRCFTSRGALCLDPIKEITHVSLVPTQLLRWIKEEKTHYFQKIECLLLGGAPLGEALIQKAIEKNLPIRTTYGMTETASQITMSNLMDDLLPPHAGSPLPGKEILISEEGEILVKGNSLFSGYDSETGPLLPTLEGGWFPTGDLGRLTSKNTLVYTGRKDNLFISGGENIYPEEIEKALNSLPNVSFSIVVPLKDDEFGERPIAFIQMETPLPSLEEFYARLASLLPKFAFPVRFLPFPKEVSLDFKIQRSKLKELANKTLY